MFRNVPGCSGMFHAPGYRRPIKKPLGKKKQEIWVGTMAHAPAVGSLSYGGFTKVRQSIVQ